LLLPLSASRFASRACHRRRAWWVLGAGPYVPLAGRTLIAQPGDNCPRVRDQRLQGQTRRWRLATFIDTITVDVQQQQRSTGFRQECLEFFQKCSTAALTPLRSLAFAWLNAGEAESRLQRREVSEYDMPYALVPAQIRGARRQGQTRWGSYPGSGRMLSAGQWGGDGLEGVDAAAGAFGGPAHRSQDAHGEHVDVGFGRGVAFSVSPVLGTFDPMALALTTGLTPMAVLACPSAMGAI
jgi:hypothetical protein